MPSYVDRTPENIAATRLLKARIAAGFTAGSSGAAPFHGWDVGRYGKDEAGRYAIPPERAAMYARGFGVDVHWMADGTRPPEADASDVAVRTRLVDALGRDDVSAVFIGLRGPSRSLPYGGGRLKEARLAAGFRRPGDAADRFGWAHGTYSPREHPCAILSSEACLVHAFAFGVEPEWLLLGDRHSPAMVRHGGPLPGMEDVAAYTERVRAAMVAYQEDRRPRQCDPDHGPDAS